MALVMPRWVIDDGGRVALMMPPLCTCVAFIMPQCNLCWSNLAFVWLSGCPDAKRFPSHLVICDLMAVLYDPSLHGLPMWLIIMLNYAGDDDF